jgi:hypothetical protein
MRLCLTSGTASQILASIPATPLVSSFRELLPDMWLLWECVLLGE